MKYLYYVKHLSSLPCDDVFKFSSFFRLAEIVFSLPKVASQHEIKVKKFFLHFSMMRHSN